MRFLRKNLTHGFAGAKLQLIFQSAKVFNFIRIIVQDITNILYDLTFLYYD